MEKFENIIDFLRALIFSVVVISSMLFAIDYYLVKKSEKKKAAQEEKVKNISKKTISEEKKEVKKEEIKINYKEKAQETKKVIKEERTIKEENLENFLADEKNTSIKKHNEEIEKNKKEQIEIIRNEKEFTYSGFNVDSYEKDIKSGEYQKRNTSGIINFSNTDKRSNNIRKYEVKSPYEYSSYKDIEKKE